ncbi:MAG: hypothetical protein E6H03_07440 [Bacillati bacterium ANGP1]|uniref:Molybdenum cofactor biosynthesis protein MoaE n=1 Tax=Candidatus Segetimicrobium genomatis TaxID=2569760 RepID=A0A537JBX9_9BACT|nr:MAG: hypothetical protein E6H03_07440 [Terrabacteria group bacterium ANGP1]
MVLTYCVFAGSLTNPEVLATCDSTCRPIWISCCSLIPKSWACADGIGRPNAIRVAASAAAATRSGRDGLRICLLSPYHSKRSVPYRSSGRRVPSSCSAGPRDHLPARRHGPRPRPGTPPSCGTIGAVKVTVRLFASYREAAGASRVELALKDGARGPAVWAALVARFPALARQPSPAGYAVNDEYVDGAPVSGGATAGLALIEISEQPIQFDRLLAAVADPRAGAVVLFLGVVRDNARGRRVDYLQYEAYETLARREVEHIAETIAGRWPGTRIAIAHRTGRLKVGEASVAISVSAPHRAEAFEAARFAIDALKQTVPIWKKEIWEGGEAWVGAEP